MSADSDSTAPRPGFTWGETDEIHWLRSPEGEYKRIHPELLGDLRAVAAGEIDLEDLPEKKRNAVATLRDEGYLTDDGRVERIEVRDDLALAPRVLAFLAAFGALGAITVARWDVAWPPSSDPWVNLWALPFFFAAAILHEFGHYTVAKRYFDPEIGVGLLNGVFPALVTRTDGAWACPRSVRIWISLAGPFVDILLTLALAVAHLYWSPGAEFLSTLVLVQFFRILFVFNPLLDGDGYWILVDATGAVNLRSRGFRDLRELRPTKAALFSLAAAVFTVFCVVVAALALGRMFGLT